MSAALLFPVPAGTRPSTCRSCGREVFWIVTAAGRRMPVDCTVEGGERPTRKGFTDPSDAPGELTPKDGAGASHFATCPQAEQWRTRERPSKRGAHG